MSAGTQQVAGPWTPAPPQLVMAYSVCKGITRSAAKNFYYAFRVLPEHKRNAMCAVYAFMRRADDIADNEAMPIAERREVMARWVESWRAARRSGISTDPVFVALNDTQKRFAIPDTLLEELVQGTTMDLEPRPESEQVLQTFATFDDLYRYCYLVASVVGLVCIKIFGYTDLSAEKLAEETGVGVQIGPAAEALLTTVIDAGGEWPDFAAVIEALS